MSDRSGKKITRGRWGLRCIGAWTGKKRGNPKKKTPQKTEKQQRGRDKEGGMKEGEERSGGKTAPLLWKEGRCRKGEKEAR